MEEGAAGQPLAIALHACNRAGVKIGSKIVILGAGPIGVLCAMCAKAMGASKIAITDLNETRLNAAKQLGAVDYTILVKELAHQQVVDKIVEMLGARPDISVDACGYASAQRIAMLIRAQSTFFLATKNAGVVLVVGISDATSDVPLSQAMLREVDIRGSYRIVNTSRFRWFYSINLKKFITHHYKMADTKQALALAKAGVAMKIIINVDH